MTLKLYTARICPFAERARLVLSHKDIEHECVEIDLQNKPAYFSVDVNPRGTVPALQHDGFTLYESSICAEYLDEAFPNPEKDLMPADAKSRGRIRLLINICNNDFVDAFYANLFKSSEETQKDFEEALAQVETLIDGPFFLGNRISLADFCFVPFFERICLQSEFAKLDENWADKYPRIKEWMARMEELEACKKERLERDELVTAYRSYIERKKSGK
eukprot:ANDGO_07319.mRNA.1 Glutathione S-transferase L1